MHATPLAPVPFARLVAAAIVAAACFVPSAAVATEPWREKLYTEWKQLPEPPVTPYDGPFGPDARAFTVALQPFLKDKKDSLTPEQQKNLAAIYDYTRTAKNGVYDPKLDPRPINAEFEAAILEDWRRMGYNCAYKGNAFTFMVGSFLKEKGLLGAIDQTLWGNNGPPALQFDGKEGSKHREGCGSFFDPSNYQGGVQAITGMGHFYGKHLFTVGDHRLTCSWDEVGMRECQMDYRDPMKAEFRTFLKEVWFQDVAPGEDTNKDGRTYNGFTGEKLASWDEVEPIHVSLNWTDPVWNKDGSRGFSKMPDVDAAIFAQPARYKLLVDFHRYFTFEFFRRTNEDATKAMNAAGTPGRISCYPFTQHFIIWPGANHKHANSFYWYHRLSPVVNVEHCWPEAPVMNLNYAITDRLSARHKNPVMAWVWFYFGQEGWDQYNGPHDIDRAMARIMGHAVDGTHHWLYSPVYRGRDQKQRLQIASWQNFFKTHYDQLLAEAKPVKPQVALLMPDTTGFFYRYFQYPKQDFGWTAEAFQNLQLPYDLLTEEEVELGETKLSDYKVLYVVGSEWSVPAIREKIAAYIKDGGVVFANVDSLSLDVSTGKRIDFLEKHFGVKIARKHKNAFYPSTQSVEEALWALPFDTWGGPVKVQGHMVHELDDPRAWAKLYARTQEKYLLDENGKPKRPIPPSQGMQGGRPVRDPSYKLLRDKDGKLVRDEAVWKQLDEAMAKIPKGVLGIPQSPLDMRSPPVIRYAEGVSSVPPAVTWSEVDEATPVGSAKPIAWWGEKVVGIETDKTVWFGTREGMSLHAISSRMEAHRGTEPCNPFPSEMPDSYEANRPYAEALGHAARKAGVTRPVTLTTNGKLPMNLEVLPRVAADGTLFVVVINHDKTDATYDAAIDPSLVPKGAAAWELLTAKELAAAASGPFTLAVPALAVRTFVVGTPASLAAIKERQAKLAAMDMSVPKYFVDRPELNRYEWGTPVPPIGK